MLRVLSLGAGVQSTTMLLMGLRGEFGDIPDCAIFADTGWEPPSVYQHLEWLDSHVKSEYGFTIHRVSAGNIRDDALAHVNDSHRFASMPLYTQGKDGKIGKMRRQCTREYKIAPLLKKQRELVGLRPRQRARGVMIETWVGISLDEATRMKPPEEKWIQKRYPLVDARITRGMCLKWLRDNGYPTPPKSACIGCPFHDNGYWRSMRNDTPEVFQEAVSFDEAIRFLPRKFRQPTYLHRSGKPLDEVDLSTPQDHGQQEFSFDEECAGVCGV